MTTRNRSGDSQVVDFSRQTVLGLNSAIGVAEGFVTAIPFDNPVTVMTQQTISANITLTIDTTNQQIGYGAIAKFLADGSHTINISAFKETTGSSGYDNRSGIINIFQFLYDGVDHWVNIFQELNQTPLDLTPPSLSSATVEAANPNKIILTYSESLDTGSVPATTDFAVSGGKTVSSVAIVGAVVTVTVNSNYGAGDTITISYTPGTNKIRDAAANNAVALSSQSVINNIFTATPLTFTTNTNLGQSGTTLTASAANGTAISDYKIPSGSDGYFQVRLAGADAVSGLIGINLSALNEVYANWEYHIFVVGTSGSGHYYRSPSAVDLGVTWTTNDYMRVGRFGGSIKVEYSANGTSWTTLYDFGAQAGDLFLMAQQLVNGNKIYLPVGYGVVAR